MQQRLDALTYGLTDLLTPAGPPISLRHAVAVVAPRPVLLIAAGAVADEQTVAGLLSAASGDAVQVWTVPGAGHTQGLRVDPVQWQRRVTTFLADALPD